MPVSATALLAAVVLGALHLEGRRLPRVGVVPRSAVLSAASGIAVAYVFVHLLPEVAAIQMRLEHRLAGGPVAAVERHAWLLALAGLAAFYGLELAARRSVGAVDGSGASDTVGWLHLASYGLYNGVIGVVLTERAREGLGPLLLFGGAMGVHFLVNDHGLRAHHGALYRHAGRWIVAAAVVVGAVVGVLHAPSRAAVGTLVAFLAGGIVLNVMKEELPEGRRSRWVPFALGAAMYAALLLLV